MPPPQPSKGPQILTDRIKCTEVRLVDGEDNRVVSREEAERLAEERGLDLVIVSLTSSPPVVRLTDFGKFKFEAEKKAREAKKKQHVVAVKEIKMGIRIDDHDYLVKVNRAKKFLEEGNKVKMTIRLKGREVQHTNLAFDLARRFVADLEDYGSLESQIRMEGARQLTMNLTPGKTGGRSAAAHSEAAPEASSEDEPELMTEPIEIQEDDDDAQNEDA